MNDSTPIPSIAANVDLPEEPAEQLWRLWRRGGRPDLGAFLQQAGGLPPQQLAAALRIDQRERWQTGERVPAETYLDKYPDVRAHTDSALDLIYSEFLLRERLGERPDREEYLARFPDHADVLEAQIALHRALAAEPDPLPEASEALGGETLVPSPYAPADPAWPHVPGYEIVAEVGRGGMGVVYKARDAQLKRFVALKLLLAGVLADREQRARFRREAEAVARLQHPNIVQVFEVGEAGGHAFLALEFVDSGTLRDKIGGAPQPPRAAAELVETLARAAHYAHQHGVVHRDLKPANVLLASSVACAPGEPGRVSAGSIRGADARDTPGAYATGLAKIADFGLAKQVSDGTAQGVATQSGAILGTPGYMAPEQAAGRLHEVGPAADIHALGAILYELLTGRPPFHGETPLATLQQVMVEEPLPPSRWQRKLPRDLETICLKCLQKQPAQRYASALALAEDLGRFLAGEPIRARPVGSAERLWRWCRRNPVLAGLTSGLALLLLVLLVSLWVSSLLRGERDQAHLAQQRAETAETEVRSLLVRAQEAERQVTIRSHLSRAAAIRHRGQVGQRFECLAELTKALQLGPSVELRDEIRTEAIAALALPDLEVVREWDGCPAGTVGLDCDDSMERYVRLDKHGEAAVFRLTAAGEEEVARIPAHGQPPFRGPWLSRDGRHVLIGHGPIREGTAAAFRVWQLDGAMPELVLDEKVTVYEHAVSFRPGGGQLAVGHLDRSVSVYDLKTRQPVCRLQLDSLPHILAFHPKANDGRLAVACGSAVRIFDVDQAGQQREKKPLRHPNGFTWTTGLAWHPDGRRLASACNTGIFLWDAETAAELTLPWEGLRHEGVSLAFNHAGDRLVSDDWGGQTRLWDAETGRLLLTAPNWCGRRFSRDDGLLGPGQGGGKVRLHRVAPGHELRVIRRPGAAPKEIISTPVLDADGRAGRLLAVGSTSGWLSFFDLASGRELASRRLPQCVPDVRGFYPGRGWLIGLNEGSGKRDISFWPSQRDARDAGLLRIGPPQRLATAAFAASSSASPTGHVVAVPDGNNGAWVLHLDEPGKVVLVGPQYDVRQTAVSSDGRWVVTCSHWSDQRGKSARIWDAATGKHVRDLPVEGATAAAFSADGRWLATCTIDRGCKLWEVGSWREARDCGGVGFAFSPDSRLLAFGDTHGLIRLTEVETGREVARLTFPEPGWYAPACFSPDGAYLIATHSEQKALYVWDLRLLRRQLKAMGLDWEAPDYPPASTRRGGPLRLIVDDGTPAGK